jgi:pyruvate/2-oxoglutarate dehydrogenase complex dihydrolipoamide acyltransferase (E2) component
MSKNYKVHKVGLERRLVEDACAIGKKIPFAHAVWELDVTDIRDKIREVRKKNKSPLSLTTFLLYAFVQTINENKRLQATKNWLNQWVVFDDVDVFFPIEIENEVVLPKIIRKANKKSIFELENEINLAKKQKNVPLDSAKRIFLRYPKFIRHFFYKLVMRLPFYRKDTFGLAYFTSLNNPAVLTKGFGIPVLFHPVGMCVGFTENKEVLINGEIKIRKIVSITNSVDHNITDGGVFTRFCIDLKLKIDELIQTL